MDPAPLAQVEAAGLALNGEPARSRHVAWTLAGADDDAPRTAWAWALDLWDRPPPWVEVPALDLQPELVRRVYAALAGATGLGVADGRAPDEVLGGAFHEAHEALVTLRTERPTLFAGSAACAAGVVVVDGRAALGWLGTARVFRIREGRCEKLTRDHTAVDEDGARKVGSEQLRKVLLETPTRLVGEGDPGAEVVALELRPGDLYVVATGKVDDEACAALLERRRDEDAPTAALAVVRSASRRFPGHALGVAVVRVGG